MISVNNVKHKRYITDVHIHLILHIYSWIGSSYVSKQQHIKGLSKFAKLARSVTRSRTVLASQFSSHIPAPKETVKQSNFAHVSYFFDIIDFNFYRLKKKN